MKETVYGVFSVRGDREKPSIVKLMGNEFFYDRNEANLRAGDLKINFNIDFEVREIKCEVR